ncbi:MAG: PD-(D/E)XK nuclease family protein [Flavobacteriales bacterium]
MNFITKVANYILDKEGKNISEALIIVPGKRIGVFLKQALEAKMETSMFFPKIIGIQEWIETQTSLTSPHTIRLQIECYQAYIEVCNTNDIEPDSLQKFLKWSSTLINDFNEIDKSLVDAKSILDNLKNFSNIDDWSENLTEIKETKLSTSHRNFWTIATEIYFQFQKQLLEKKWGYNGMILRDVAHNISEYKTEFSSIYIIGFNALSAAEEKIFDHLVTKSNAKLLWDIDEQLFNDQSQETGYFLRKYHKKWSQFIPSDFDWKAPFFKEQKKNMAISGTNGVLRQAEIGNDVLLNWTKETTSIQDMAVVLCDEKALIPFLNRLPSTVSDVNITMGYSMQNTPVISFVQNIFDVLDMDQNYYHLKTIETFLNHPFLKFIDSKQLIEHCKEKRIWREDYLTWISLFKKFELEDLTYIFKSEHTAKSILSTGYRIIKYIYDKKPKSLALESEYLYSLHQVWHQCIDILEEFHAFINHPQILKNFLNTILRQEKLDFIGNPIGGLQIMGMLETRLLDFSNLIFVGINEGVMPKGNTQDSLIPIEIRQYYNMTTFLEKDAIYAYHFFRLIQRSKNIQYIYNTNLDSAGGGNISRFVQQIEKEWALNDNYKQNIHHQTYSVNNKPFNTEEIFEKGDFEKKILQEKAIKGISASFINQYFTCPLEFYKSRILGIKTINNEDKINHAELGTAVHNVLETLYNQNLNTPLTTKILSEYKKQIPELLKQEFSQLGSPQFLNQAQNKIRHKVSDSFLNNMIDLDVKTLKKEGELMILENEKKCTVYLEVPGLDKPVKLDGFIDRIDKVNDTYRIVDYKTGTVKSVNMDRFFDDILEDRTLDFTKQFQVMFYGYLIYKNNAFEGKSIQSGLISFRQFQKEYQALKEKRKTYDFIEHMEEFEQLLIKILQEILLEDKPFAHPEAKVKGCYYC